MADHSKFDELSLEEQAKVLLQVQYFTTVLMRQWGVSETEIPALVQTLRWTAQHRAFLENLAGKSAIAVAVTICGAALLTMWEGIKHLLGRITP